MIPQAWRPPLGRSSSQAPKTSTPSRTKQSLTKPGAAQFSGLADARPQRRKGGEEEEQAKVTHWKKKKKKKRGGKKLDFFSQGFIMGRREGAAEGGRAWGEEALRPPRRPGEGRGWGAQACRRLAGGGGD